MKRIAILLLLVAIVCVTAVGCGKAVQATVSFDAMNGSEILHVSVDMGSAVSQPETPAKAGYRFVGWVLPNG